MVLDLFVEKEMEVKSFLKLFFLLFCIDIIY